MQILKNEKLRTIFNHIIQVKQAMYFYEFLLNQCNSDYNSPVKMFCEYSAKTHKSLDSLQDTLEEISDILQERIKIAINNLTKQSYNYLLEKNFDFNRNVYEAIDSFAWDYYQYYNKPYEEIDLPHILKDMLDNIVDIAEFPKGEYHVLCPDFSYYMFSVSTLQLAEDLNNIIDHVSVYCGHEFIWEQ